MYAISMECNTPQASELEVIGDHLLWLDLRSHRSVTATAAAAVIIIIILHLWRHRYLGLLNKTSYPQKSVRYDIKLPHHIMVANVDCWRMFHTRCAGMSIIDLHTNFQ